MARQRPGRTLLFLMAVALLYFSFLGRMPLLDPDEGRYADIPREMLASGDWVTPHLNGVTYLEKPPLLYWGNALSMALLGENEFGARAFGALCSVALAWATLWIGTTLAGPSAGLVSAAFVAASPYVFAIGRINTVDNPLAPTMAFAVFAVWLYMSGRSESRPLLWGGYVAAALAFLSKGLVGIVFPGAILVLWALLAGRPHTILKGLSPVGVALFLAVSLPWVLLCQGANPDFLWFFFVREHFLRFSTKMHNRYQPFWYFLPLAVGAILPWIPFLAWKGSPSRGAGPSAEVPRFGGPGGAGADPAAGGGGSGANGAGATAWWGGAGASGKTLVDRCGGEGGLLLWCWFLFVLLFFSASSSKLPTYLLPLLPPLCVLAGTRASRWMESGEGEGEFPPWMERLPGLIAAVVALMLLAGFVLAPRLGKETLPDHWALDVLPAGAAVVAYSIFPLLSGSLSRRARLAGSVASFSLFLVFIHNPLEHLVGYRSSKHAAAVIAGEAAPGDAVAVTGDFRHGLPFYLKRQVIYSGGKGELEFGIERDPRRDEWYLGREDLLRLWNSDRRVFLLISGRMPEKEMGAYTGGRLLWRTRKGILLVNR